MSLKLRKVELTNIRSHAHVVFEPEETGITAIQGVNGTGKSTIVDSIAWTLYGTKPNGVKKMAEIFKSGITETDRASARVDLDVDGQHIRFERRRANKHGAIEAEVWAVTTDEAGEEKLEQLAGPSVSHAEPFIRKLLKMNEDGFLAAILVQQKQVDQLVLANPRERGAVIEKLTGIAGITAGLIESRQELNVLKKSAAGSSIDEKSLEKLKERRGTLSKDIVESQARLRETKARGDELRTQGEAAKEKLAEATDKADKKAALDRRINELSTRAELKKEQLEETVALKDSERKAIAGANGGGYDALAEKVSELQTQRDRLNRDQSRSEDLVSSLKNEADKLTTELSSTRDVTEFSVEELEEAIQAASDARAALAKESGAIENQIRQTKKAIEVISGGDSCPTCLQKVADAAGALQVLNDSVTKAQESLQAKAEESTELKKTFEERQEELHALVKSTAAQARLEEIEGLRSEAKKALDRTSSDLRVLEKELKSVNGLFDEARKLRDRQAAYKELLSKAQRLSDEVESMEYELRNLKKEDAELEGASQRSINALQKKLDDARSRYSSLTLEFTKDKGALDMKRQEIEFLTTDIARHEEAIRKHKELLESVAVAAHTVELVSEFREERIRNSIPLIEVYASDLLTRFTEGKFTRLTLNQKFEATVHLADGSPRSVGLLSGGELSAAAMSLRLAIAMLLNSGSDQNVVILDEVLVSQDVARAEQILATIKELFKGQVVLIAHNEAIDSVADKIVSLAA